MLAIGMDCTKFPFNVMDLDQEAHLLRYKVNKIAYDQRNLWRQDIFVDSISQPEMLM